MAAPPRTAPTTIDVDLARRPDHFLVGFSDDVGDLLLFVPSNEPVSPGERRTVRLALPTGRTFEALAEVRHHRDGRRPGFALAFLSLASEARDALGEFVRASLAPPSRASSSRISLPPDSRGPASRRSFDRVPAQLDVQIESDVDVEAEVTLHSEHQFYAGFSENISDGGLFVQSWAHHEVGAHLTLRFTLPDDETPIETIGEVRWTRAYDRAHDTPPGIGVAFLDLSTRDRARIDRFLKQRRPLFYDE